MRVLDIAANVVLIAVCGVVLVKVTQQPRNARTGQLPHAAASSTYAVGDALDLSEIEIPSGTEAVFLVISSRCGYCKASLPFYSELVTKLRRDRREVSVVAMCQEPSNTCNDFLKGGGVDVDRVVDARGRAVRVRGTPTLLIVDSSGTITHIWSGRLDVPQQLEVLEALHATP